MAGLEEDAVLKSHPYFNAPPGRRVKSRTCPTATRPGGESWLVQRLGSVKSNGGYNWHTFAGGDLFDLQSVLDNLSPIWITALAIFPVTEDGRLMGYPPLHMHHSHLGAFRTPGLLDYIGALSFPHGDSICRAEDGGSACFMFSLPPGHGIPVHSQLLLSAMVNDVREPNAAPISFSLELAIRYTLVAQRAVGLSFASAAADFQGGMLSSLQTGHQLFGQFNIPSDNEAVLWSTMKIRASGRLLNLWLHTHPLLGFEEEWLISGTPQELGLNNGIFHAPRCYRPFIPSEHSLTSDTVRAHILAHVKALGLKFRCIFKANSENVSVIHGVDGIVSRAYDRQSRLQCFAGADRLVEGGSITTVTFFSGKMCVDPAVCLPGALVENHMHFQGYTVFDGPQDNLLKYDFLTQYTSYALNSQYASTCGNLNFLAGPDVCVWEIPGCRLPGMPTSAPKLIELMGVILRTLLSMTPG